MFVGEVHIQTGCPRMASGRNRVQLDVYFELLDKTVYLAPGSVLCCTSVRPDGVAQDRRHHLLDIGLS